MNFANVKGITIPEGAVKALSIGGVKVWDKLGGGTYTVTWKNHDGSVLEIDTNVPYGTVPTYNGADPTHTNPDYVWNGWSPAVEAITGDTTYTAKFKGSSYVYAKLIDRSISGEYTNDAVTNIGSHAFSSCSNLTTANFPAATSIGDYAFSSCSNLTTADFPAATSIGSSAFSDCSALTTVNFPAATSIGQAFVNCSALTTVDFHAATSIKGYAFSNCPKLSAIILRSQTVCTLDGSAVGGGSTPFASGAGYIYVPRALVDSYKAASNWSKYAAQFRAIEDYPDICGGESA